MLIVVVTKYQSQEVAGMKSIVSSASNSNRASCTDLACEVSASGFLLHGLSIIDN